MSTMKLMNIEMTLDPASVSEALMKIKFLQNGVKRMLDAMCEALLKEGVQIAKIKLSEFKIGEGPLSNSIKQIAYDRTTGIGYITAGEGLIAGNMTPGYPLMSYAIFVEEGFGSQGGKKNQATSPTSMWAPKLNLPVKSKGWVYLNEKDDHFYTSYGQPPKPFMYKTFSELRLKASMDAKKYIAEYIPHD